MNHVDSCNFALLERRVTELEKKCKELTEQLARAGHELALYRPVGPYPTPFPSPTVPYPVVPWIQPNEPYSPIINFIPDGG